MRVPSAVLRQVMLNMLLNGVSAAGEPGAVHAELRADADRRHRYWQRWRGSDE